MMRHKDFAAFILTHGRPNNQLTYQSLRASGYTGKIYLIVDDEDMSLDEYKKLYKKEVLVFSKDEVAKYIDTGDLSTDRRTILYARNVNFDFAEKLGIKYFLQLDDDYTGFGYRYIEGGKLKEKGIKGNMDAIFDVYLDFLDKTPAMTVAFLQGGDLIAGVKTFLKEGFKRKAMNSFFCKTSNRFYFRGRLNDDVNTYLTYGAMGKLFCSMAPVMLHQIETQKGEGGMSDTYKEGGTYQKAFTSIMYAPSCVRVGVMATQHGRIHHKILWKYAVPKIVSDKYRKVVNE